MIIDHFYELRLFLEKKIHHFMPRNSQNINFTFTKKGIIKGKTNPKKHRILNERNLFLFPSCFFLAKKKFAERERTIS